MVFNIIYIVNYEAWMRHLGGALRTECGYSVECAGVCEAAPPGISPYLRSGIQGGARVAVYVIFFYKKKLKTTTYKTYEQLRLESRP